MLSTHTYVSPGYIMLPIFFGLRLSFRRSNFGRLFMGLGVTASTGQQLSSAHTSHFLWHRTTGMSHKMSNHKSWVFDGMQFRNKQRARKHDFSKFLEGFVTIDKTWMNQKTKEQSKKGLSRTQKISCQKIGPCYSFLGQASWFYMNHF